MSEPITPLDVRAVAAATLELLRPHAAEDWTRTAGGLEWDCRTTLAHMTFALDRYCLYLAGPASERLPYQMPMHAECTPADLMRVLELRAAALCQIATAAPPGTRGYHAYGRPDAGGYVAMGCVELLVHTEDIAQGLGIAHQPPGDVTGRALARLFPWAPTDDDPWQALQWATGRLELPGHGRLAPDWAWQGSPLSEWDGTRKTVASYR